MIIAEIIRAVKSFGKIGNFSFILPYVRFVTVKKYAPPKEVILPAIIVNKNFESKGEIIITAAPVEATEKDAVNDGKIKLSRREGKVCKYARST